jgi:hypothetical protein
MSLLVQAVCRTCLALVVSAGIVSAKTACEVLPIEDAVVVLSQNAQQRDLGRAGCLYEIQTPYLALRVRPPRDAAKAGYGELKQSAKQTGAVVKDEPGIGSAAFSVVTKDREEIYVIQGSAAFSISLSNPGSSTPLPDLMNKMRDVVKRAVSRL